MFLQMKRRDNPMILEELEEALVEILGDDFSIRTDDDGQLIVFTGLMEDDNGELTTFYTDEEDEPTPDPDLKLRYQNEEEM
jgi:hypothetical protein